MADFVFEGEEVPLLLRKRVVLSVVAAFGLMVVAYAVATIVFDIPTSFDAEPFKDWVDGFGVWGPVVYILVLALSVLIAPIPNIPIFIAAGLAWGPVVGTIYSMAGMMLGSVIAFWGSRWVGRKHLPRLVGAKAAERLAHLADTMGGRVVFWARMIPAVNFDWISFVSGLTSIRFWPFFIGTFFGMLVPTTVGVAAGDSLAKDVRITIAIGAVWIGTIALSALYFWWRRQRMRSRAVAAE